MNLINLAAHQKYSLHNQSCDISQEIKGGPVTCRYLNRGPNPVWQGGLHPNIIDICITAVVMATTTHVIKYRGVYTTKTKPHSPPLQKSKN